MWYSPQQTEHVSCDNCRYAPEVMAQRVHRLVAQPRHSGFIEDDEGHAHYSISRLKLGESSVTESNIRIKRGTTTSRGDPTRTRRKPSGAKSRRMPWRSLPSWRRDSAPEFWKLPPEQTMGRVGQMYRELEKDGVLKTPLAFTASAMRAKIDEAYAPRAGAICGGDRTFEAPARR